MKFISISILAMLSFLLTACTGLMAPSATPTPVPTRTPTPTPAPTPTPLSPELLPTSFQRSNNPTYAKWGKFSVGSAFTVFNKDTNPIWVYIWYPVRDDRTPETTGAPFPLIVFSPGATGSGNQYDYLIPQIASYGFVVISWDPNENNNPKMDTWLGNRYAARKLLIDYADQMTVSGGQLAGFIDMQRIGVIGYSLGGWTALIEGGAQMSFQWCKAHPELVSQDQEITCQVLAEKEHDIAASLGLDAAPSGLWPTLNDPRVSAIVALAPMGKFWGAGYEGVATIKIPAMIMTGSDDPILRPELGAYPIYEHLGSPMKSLVVFQGNDHFIFNGGGERESQITHLVVAYLLAALKGDAEAIKALSPANITFPGVKYETTDFK